MSTGQATPLRIRPYREGDIPAIVRLIDAIAEHLNLGKRRSEDEIRSRFESPGFDPTRSAVIVEGTLPGVAEGVPLGAAVVTREGEPDHEHDYITRVWVHPSAESGDLTRVLYDRMIDIAREQEAELPTRPPRPVMVYAAYREGMPARREVIESLGMSLNRVFWVMERSLAEPIDEPRQIEGVTIRTYRRPEDNAAGTISYNDSFRDHWDHHDESLESWNHAIAAPSRRPDLSWVAEIDDELGRFAGFCLCVIHEDDNRASNRKEGYIELLGTIRGWRGKGLGKSLLLHGLRSLRSAGLDTALLGVDSISPTGANKLYESVGFTVRYRDFIYNRPLEDFTP
jgi:mycothiol synthase